MATIKVPKPAKGSFNKDRPVSDLIRAQLRHWHEAEKKLPHHHRTGRNIEEIKTEGEASEYLKTVTARCHIQGKVKVPRPVSGSFHKHRPISDLLKTQIEHFHEVELRWPEDKRTGIEVHSIKTEHEAATYLKKMTGILHGNIQPTSPAKQDAIPSKVAKTRKTTVKVNPPSNSSKG
jgi:hypothetical protein